MGDVDSNVTNTIDRVKDEINDDIVCSSAGEGLDLLHPELQSKYTDMKSNIDPLGRECLENCAKSEHTENDTSFSKTEQVKYSNNTCLQSHKENDTVISDSMRERLRCSSSSSSEAEIFQDAVQEHNDSIPPAYTSETPDPRVEEPAQDNFDDSSPETSWAEEFPTGCTEKVHIDVDQTNEDNAKSTLETDLNSDLFNDDEAESKENVINEEFLKEQESLLSEEEKQARQNEARRLKEAGNEEFKNGNYVNAVELYTDALVACLMTYPLERSVLYANRGTAKMKLDKLKEAVEDSTKALTLNPDYMKALLRRAELYERTDKLDEALADYQKALERDPSIHQARAACMRLPEQIAARNEKMKTEMLGKLKDLGNMILRPFGLSTNNFNLQQDPNTGSYSVSFQQQPQK